MFIRKTSLVATGLALMALALPGFAGSARAADFADTDAALKKRIDDMGYTTTMTKWSTGPKVTEPRGGRDWFFYATVSGDKSKVWLKAPMATLPATARADVLEKLLAKNEELAGMYFSVDSSRMVWLNLPLDNSTLAPAGMRKAIDSLVTTMDKTETLWNPAKYPPAPGAAAPAPLPMPGGVKLPPPPPTPARGGSGARDITILDD